jgi:hypothetical protein
MKITFQEIRIIATGHCIANQNIFLSMCDVKVFLTFTFTEYGTVLTTILPILFLYLNTVIVRAGAFELPNSEQSYKGKVKIHNYINRQNQSTTGKLGKRNDPDLVQAFLKKWWVESDFKAKFTFRYQDLVEIYSVSAEKIISDAFSYSENV